MASELILPDKEDFKIGEVCEIVGVKPFVLRYWETEFAELSPTKGSGGQRTYTRHDVEVIQRIKQLLYEERFTVAGAKKRLAEELSARKPTTTKKKQQQQVVVDSPPPDRLERLRQALAETRDELHEILASLK